MLLIHNIPHFEYLVHRNCIQANVKLLVIKREKRFTGLGFKKLFFTKFFSLGFYILTQKASACSEGNEPDASPASLAQPLNEQHQLLSPA